MTRSFYSAKPIKIYKGKGTKMANNSRKNKKGIEQNTADFNKQTRTPIEDDPPIQQTISFPKIPSWVVPIVLVTVAIFLFFCLVLDTKVGIVGKFFKNILTGILGGGAFFVPIFMIVTAIFWRRDTINCKRLSKSIFATVCVLFISVLFYDFSSIARAVDSGETEFSLSTLWQGGIEGIGGGVLGGLIGQGLNLCIGTVGTIIVAMLIIAIFVVFYLGIDVASVSRIISRKIKASISASKARRAEERTEAAKRAEARRIEEEKRAASVAATAAPARRRSADPASIITDEFDTVDACGYDDAIIDSGVAEENAQPARTPLPKITYGPASGISNTKRKASVFDFDSDEEERESEIISPTPTETQVIHPVTNSPEELDDEPIIPARRPSKRDQIIESLEDDFSDDDIVIAPKSYSDFEKITSTESDDAPVETVRPTNTISEPLSEAPKIEEEVKEPPKFAPAPKKEEAESDQHSGVLILPEMIIDKSSVAKNAKELAPIVTDEEPIEESAPVENEFKYQFPPYSLLKSASTEVSPDMNAEIQANADKLIETLASFNVRARISSIARGPRITRYELVPDAGIRIRSIANLVDDISMNLASAGIRIEAPIPGKAAVGIEVPNRKSSTVSLRDLLDTDAYRSIPSKTCVCLGSDVAGDPIFCDIAKMPHMLIAGATGMGKSVCINVIITSLLYKADPSEVKLILIDPKKVELGIYGGIPHLLVPVVNDPQKAAGALSWAVGEMERRFDIFEDIGVRDIKGYNKLNSDSTREKLPSIIIIIDELHDLMMVSPDSVEKSIVRIAQKARAAGIHLILGTQRPSVDVITGVIKANVPSRIAFHVASQVDSRTILDMVGAEKLLNNGDMLYMAVSESKAKRVQGAYVDEDDVSAVTTFIKNQTNANVYNEEVMKDIEREAEKCESGNKKSSGDVAASEGGEDLINDPKFRSAIELSIEFQKISTSLLQRKLGIGYGKAAKFIDQMHEMGIVSAPDGQKPRNVLITYDQYLEMIARNGD